MATVYLNVGMPKTGTSFWQSILRENEEKLNQQNISFPDMSKILGIKGAQDRNAYFLLSQKYAEASENKKVMEHAWEVLRELSSRYQTIILSDEGLWSKAYGREHFWPMIVKDFERIGCQLKVVIYLRRQDQFMESLWNQHIKGQNRISKTFRECIESDHYAYFPLDYYEVLSHISDHVGRENLYVRVYEKGQLQGKEGTILSDFCEVTGICQDTEFTRSTVKNNLSLHGNFIEIRRRINAIPDFKSSKDFIESAVLAANVYSNSSIHAKDGMFTFQERKKFMDYYEESNRKVALEFLHRKDGILFYHPLEDLPVWKIDEETLSWDMLAVFTEVFIQQQKQIDELKKQVEKINKSLIFRGYRKLRAFFHMKS